ncbi:relaxin-3 [Spea bombifrons]|uniref:relaxin-3 n=1 Tax=Spea bombifrons TaxID=233779 RepID=UPI00234ADE43|nr:relaxin-3 [Spea bombifrons]
MQRPAPALLTVLWLLAWPGGTHATSRVPSFGVKLCGREFIRAVIFTCGGSRWRRNDPIQTDMIRTGKMWDLSKEQIGFKGPAGDLRVGTKYHLVSDHNPIRPLRTLVPAFVKKDTGRTGSFPTGDPADVFGNLIPSDVSSEEDEMFSEWASNLRPHNGDLMDYGASKGWRDPPGSRHGAGATAEDTLRGVERRGREVALGLSNTCCKWGCSKSQISSLC